MPSWYHRRVRLGLELISVRRPEELGWGPVFSQLQTNSGMWNNQEKTRRHLHTDRKLLNGGLFALCLWWKSLWVDEGHGDCWRSVAVHLSFTLWKEIHIELICLAVWGENALRHFYSILENGQKWRKTGFGPKLILDNGCQNDCVSPAPLRHQNRDDSTQSFKMLK